MTVCDEDSVPQMFSISCTFNSPVLPSWNITGVFGASDINLISTHSIGSFTYPMGTTSANNDPGVATLLVDSSVSKDIAVGTCFRCEFSPDPVSDQACVKIVGELCKNLSFTIL